MKKLMCIFLSVLLILSTFPIIIASADNVVEIFNGKDQVIDKLYLQEYKSVTLSALAPNKDTAGAVTGTEIDLADGKKITWSSNLPLLADVDENGKVTAYDFSKRAIIQLWIDENIRILPLVGDSMAEQIWKSIDSSGIDVDNTNTDVIVGLVSAIAGQALGESLRKTLDNMNVEITASVVDSNGKVIGSDKIEIVVEKNLMGSVSPTGVHITNRKVVPTTVAVGSSVQLYGVCTPVRLKQGIKWTVGKTIFDTESSKHAKVSTDGLVTFTSPGTATIRINPQDDIHAVYTNSITFTILDPKDLPVKSYEVVGPKEVSEGATVQLAIDNLDPPGAYRGDLTWQSSNPSVAVVDGNGIVTGLDGGSGITYSNPVTITATMGGISVNYEMKVTRKVVSELSSIEITGNKTLGVGEAHKYQGTIYPTRLNTSTSVKREWGYIDSVTGEKIPATAEAPAENGIITIASDGTVTSIAAGVSTIYCKATQSEKEVVDTFEIVCGKAITDFTINGDLKIKEGATSILSLNVTAPQDYEPELLKTIKWTSSDTSVATIDPNGKVLGRDAGGRALSSTKTTTITATVSGISKSVTLTVTGQGSLAINKYSDGEVQGTDAVIVDIPRQYAIKTYPTRIDRTDIFWGVSTNDGTAPWSASQTYNGKSRNVKNDFSLISDTGVVTGIKAGKTTVYAYAKNLLSTYIEVKKEVDIVEIVPNSINITAPTKTEYLEGDTELDLTGLSVSLTYDKEAVGQFYPDADTFTSEQLNPSVTDYSVSKLNPNILDTEQYIVVSVTRAGKVMSAVFPVIIKSKVVESLDITPPTRYEYIEGDKIDFTGLSGTVNYSNAPSEAVDVIIDESTINLNKFDEEQQIRVYYEHAGRTAEAFFPIIIYGIPKVSYTVKGQLNDWTTEPITFTFSSTHTLDGVTYYYQNYSSGNWVRIDGNTLTINKSINKPFHFKAVNSKNITSPNTKDVHVMFDDTAPTFDLVQETTNPTNQDYSILIDNLVTGISGVKSLKINGIERGKIKAFKIDRNDVYSVSITAGNNLKAEKYIVVNNIDKDIPTITSIETKQIEEDLPQFPSESEGLNSYYSGTVKITAFAKDIGTAGIDKIRFRLTDENRSPVTNWDNYSSETGVLFDYNFKGFVEFVAVDKAGNRSASFYSDGFVRDGSKPVITDIVALSGEEEYTPGSWAADIVSLSPNASAFSNIKEYYYKIDNGTWQKLTKNSVEILKDGVFTYSFKAVSYSGLESDVKAFTVKIDRTVPLVRVDFDGIFGTWTSEDVKFNLSTLNLCPSGCTYYIDDGTGFTRVDGNTVILNKSTNAFYRFKAVNGAGLESAPSDSYKVMIDKTEPTAEVIYSVTEKTDTPYDLVIVPHVGEAGVRKIYFDSLDITHTLKATVSGNGKHIITIIGNNLLSSSKEIEVTNFSALTDAEFTYERIDSKSIKITGFKSNCSNLTIPMVIDSFDVKELGESAFLNAKNLKSVSVPNTVTKISANAFTGCDNLVNITIPESVTSIDKTAFGENKNITIYCYDSSPALAFAKEMGYKYVLLDLKAVGKTVINEDAGIIFTMEQSSNDTNNIISSKEGFNIVGVPSFIGGGKGFYGTDSLIYVFKNGSLYKTYTVIVYGDINGDSTVDSLDLVNVQRAHTNKGDLSGNTLLAADLTRDGIVEANDYQQIINLALGN